MLEAKPLREKTVMVEDALPLGTISTSAGRIPIAKSCWIVWDVTCRLNAWVRIVGPLDPTSVREYVLPAMP